MGICRQVVWLLSFRTLVVCRCLQTLGSRELRDCFWLKDKHIAVALAAYISVCSVTSYHACNGGNCLHCHNISSAGASWLGTLQQLLRGTSPRSPGAGWRPTRRRSPATRQALAAPTQCRPWRLGACRALGVGSLLPALAFPPEPFTAHSAMPKGGLHRRASHSRLGRADEQVPLAQVQAQLFR